VFFANAAWLALAVLAHNLGRWTLHAAGGPEVRERAGREVTDVELDAGMRAVVGLQRERVTGAVGDNGW
jgi:hypothetical protein